MKINEKNYTLDGSSHITRRFLLISLIGILLSYVGYKYDPKFIHSYLVCYLFFTTLSLGGLFFVLAHHIFGADWSVSIRRFGENLMVVLPLMLFLSFPIVLNFDKIYEWTDPLPEKNKQVSYNDKHDSHYQANHGDEPHTHSINQNDEENNHYDKSKKRTYS